MGKNEQTSPRVGSIAGKALRSKKTPKKVRAPIASALSQVPDKKKKKK